SFVLCELEPNRRQSHVVTVHTLIDVIENLGQYEHQMRTQAKINTPCAVVSRLRLRATHERVRSQMRFAWCARQNPMPWHKAIGSPRCVARASAPECSACSPSTLPTTG